ncbi:MAG: pilus assembly protein [Rhizobiaceae bacterium]|nr:pilus assembly protein [Rhizobiaceae bacterium]
MLRACLGSKSYRERTLRNVGRCDAGTAAIEFAIIAPIFLFMVIGMIAYGIYFGASHSIAQISADAARVALAGLDENERQQLVNDFIQRNANDYVFVDAANLLVNAHDNVQDGTQFVVAVSYQAADLPIWNLLSGLPLPQTTILRQSTIRVGGI